MTRLVTLLVVILAAAATTSAVAAQQVSGTPRVGLLFVGSPEQDLSRRATAFRESMQSLGWIEGSTIKFEYRFANGDPSRLSANAADLAAANVDIIVGFGYPATQAARDATSAIPIVGAAVGKPIGSGLAASLAHPGGNVTGLTPMSRDIVAKQLQILKEAVPQVTKVGVLLQKGRKLHAQLVTELGGAAVSLGLTVLPVAVNTAQDLSQRFDEMTMAGADAFFVLADPRTDELRADIVTLALLHRLPGAAQLRPWVDAGVLLSYAASLSAVHRRAAFFVDKILKGAKPADLPVEQPTTFELVVNLKTAKALGFEMPPSILARADEVIE
jgi:putative tryptophan/tyrosine transport system substrate-binding protein